MSCKLVLRPAGCSFHRPNSHGHGVIYWFLASMGYGRCGSRLSSCTQRPHCHLQTRSFSATSSVYSGLLNPDRSPPWKCFRDLYYNNTCWKEEGSQPLELRRMKSGAIGDNEQSNTPPICRERRYPTLSPAGAVCLGTTPEVALASCSGIPGPSFI